MAGEPSAPVRTRPSGRVWLVALCAVSIIVFLAIVLPGVFDLKHAKRSYVFSEPVKRLAIDSKGTVKIDISPSHDGRVHVQRTSAISKDSRLIERHQLSGTTLMLKSSCTGSRFGVLRRCDLHYHVQAPARVALSIHLHLGIAKVHGFRGRLDFRADAGDFVGSGCSRQAYLSLGWGHIDFTDACTPAVIRVRTKAGNIVLTVPEGRYAVNATTHYGNGIQRPFENIIEDPAARNRLDVALSYGGSLVIKGVRP
jgi:hypothetical protein